jgi:hypothetical protein
VQDHHCFAIGGSRRSFGRLYSPRSLGPRSDLSKGVNSQSFYTKKGYIFRDFHIGSAESVTGVESSCGMVCAPDFERDSSASGSPGPCFHLCHQGRANTLAPQLRTDSEVVDIDCWPCSETGKSPEADRDPAIISFDTGQQYKPHRCPL